VTVPAAEALRIVLEDAASLGGRFTGWSGTAPTFRVELAPLGSATGAAALETIARDGRFAFLAIAAGRYRLTAAGPDEDLERLRGAVARDRGQAPAEAVLEIELSAGEHRQLSFDVAAAAIDGEMSVLGEIAAGSKVSCGWQPGEAFVRTEADAFGAFRFDGLPAGPLWVWARPPASAFDVGHQRVQAVLGQTSRVRLRAEVGRLEGVVQEDGAGPMIEQASVQLLQSPAGPPPPGGARSLPGVRQLGAQTTGHGGRFVFTAAPLGDLYFRVTAPGYLPSGALRWSELPIGAEGAPVISLARAARLILEVGTGLGPSLEVRIHRRGELLREFTITSSRVLDDLPPGEIEVEYRSVLGNERRTIELVAGESRSLLLVPDGP
jgi:hypothetical protein